MRWDELSESDEDRIPAQLAAERLSRNTKTISFAEMMGRFGVTSEDLEGEEVDFEIMPITTEES